MRHRKAPAAVVICWATCVGMGTGQDLAQVPELGQSKHLQGIPTKEQSQNKAAGPEVEGSNDPPGAGCPGGSIGGL